MLVLESILTLKPVTLSLILKHKTVTLYDRTNFKWHVDFIDFLLYFQSCYVINLAVYLYLLSLFALQNLFIELCHMSFKFHIITSCLNFNIVWNLSFYPCGIIKNLVNKLNYLFSSYLMDKFYSGHRVLNIPRFTVKHTKCKIEVWWLRWHSGSFLPGGPGFQSCHFWFRFWST